jgi:tetratricopeptide (TPR) repeat protein
MAMPPTAPGPVGRVAAALRPALSCLLALLLSWALAGLSDGDRAVELGDYRGAVEAYRRVLSGDPDHVGALTSMARALSLLASTLEPEASERSYAEAEMHAAAAIAIDPAAPEAHFERARAIGQLAQLRGGLGALDLAAEVRAELERTLELDPEYHHAMHALAMWHLRVPWILGGRRDRVLPLFERATALAPEVIAHRVGFGEALLAMDMPERARGELELALRLLPVTAVDRDDQARAQALLDQYF